MNMGKLHELLAVEPDLKSEAQRLANRVTALFTEGKGRLIGQIRTYQPLDEDGEDFADEITELATTVDDELLDWSVAFSNWLDASIQKEITNQSTRADVVLDDGVPLFENMPATALLNLEAKLVEVRQILNRIPTNDPTESWSWNADLGRFISKPRTTYKAKKMLRNHVKAEATKEHPAQVDVYTEDVRIGTWTTVIQSGMLTPVEKQTRLKLIDALIRAVKQARQRANSVDVVDVHLGKKLFAYIFGE
jgi:hypothetical protein